ncbi:hypothetical protein GQX74_002908 [Glossina fuscipes]|nr:hypothetical protein GQX74_002908 [Glossina fuscipes]
MFDNTCICIMFGQILLTANGSACSQLIGVPQDDGLTLSGKLSGTATKMKNTSSTAIAVAKATTKVSLYFSISAAPKADISAALGCVNNGIAAVRANEIALTLLCNNVNFAELELVVVVAILSSSTSLAVTVVSRESEQLSSGKMSATTDSDVAPLICTVCIVIACICGAGVKRLTCFAIAGYTAVAVVISATSAVVGVEEHVRDPDVKFDSLSESSLCMT